jgi:butyrate kinase
VKTLPLRQNLCSDRQAECIVLTGNCSLGEISVKMLRKRAIFVSHIVCSSGEACCEQETIFEMKLRKGREIAFFLFFINAGR